METTTKNVKKLDPELMLAEKWFETTHGSSVTQEQILKLVLYKLHQIEVLSERVNSIL